MKNIIVLVFVDYILPSFFLKTDRKSISVLIGPDLSWIEITSTMNVESKPAFSPSLGVAPYLWSFFTTRRPSGNSRTLYACWRILEVCK